MVKHVLMISRPPSSREDICCQDIKVIGLTGMSVASVVLIICVRVRVSGGEHMGVYTQMCILGKVGSG